MITGAGTAGFTFDARGINTLVECTVGMTITMKIGNGNSTVVLHHVMHLVAGTILRSQGMMQNSLERCLAQRISSEDSLERPLTITMSKSIRIPGDSYVSDVHSYNACIKYSTFASQLSLALD